ncbi:MAG TPA: Ig-like domain-containing protein [Terriglobia bacterium]|nr:Ig-like domain-containing protein [Terriglobia bacterium]
MEVRPFAATCSRECLLGSLVVILSLASISVAQTVPPTAPFGLTATAAACGQVNLSWDAAIDNSGTGLKAYSIWRNDNGMNTVTNIGAARTWFDDTMQVKSSATMSYYVLAMDNAGNQSLPSNTVYVSTPACPPTAAEQIVDSSYYGPLGTRMATYETTSAWLYQKLNNLSQLESWIYVNNSSTGQTSHFLLHSYPGHSQVELDYALTSATDFWALSEDLTKYDNLLVSHYQLNGTPPSSATLLSTEALGDSISQGRSMIRLQSGGLLVGWSEGIFNDASGSQTDLTVGFAYRSPTGVWAIHFPITVPNNNGGGNIVQCRMTMAQHPVDGSVWVFLKRDSFSQISALRFSEVTNDVLLDSITPGYITDTTDGNNGPEGEFPYLTASPDPTRNAILLAYQSYPYQFVFVDPLYGSMSDNIFLKQSLVSVAVIQPDASKSFIPFPNYIERITPFGMSVQSDGTIWLAYQPINAKTYTWNGVYASKYESGAWSAPVLAGFDYNNYNNASGLDRSLVYRAEEPEVAFQTPDQKIHTTDLSNLAPASADTTPPTVTITSPATGATVSGSVTIAASASDDVSVSRVELWLDGALVATDTSAPYSFTWNTATAANGSHTLQTKAYDPAGNIGTSAIVTVTVSNQTLTVAITNPTNGGTVLRNQKVTISATATDSTTITQVQFYVNSSLLGTATTAPYSYPWKVPAKSGMSYKVQAKAYDATGKSAAQTITVTSQ